MEQSLTASQFAEYLSDDEISKITPLLDRLKVLEEQKTSQENYLKFEKKYGPPSLRESIIKYMQTSCKR